MSASRAAELFTKAEAQVLREPALVKTLVPNFEPERANLAARVAFLVPCARAGTPCMSQLGGGGEWRR